MEKQDKIAEIELSLRIIDNTRTRLLEEKAMLEGMELKAVA